MSVIIRGMKMPISCYDCPIRKRNGMEILCPVCGETFSVADVNIFFYRLKNCPLGELKPHGRLIDGDRLYKQVAKFTGSPHWVAIEIKQAPTVIEAEGEE